MNKKLLSRIDSIVSTLRKRNTTSAVYMINDLTEDDIDQLYKVLWGTYKIRCYYIKYNTQNDNLSFTKVERITKNNYNNYGAYIRFKNIYRWNYIQKVIGKESDMVFKEESEAYSVYKILDK